MLKKKLLAAIIGSITPPRTYVDDVFSAYTYAGTSAEQRIKNGIQIVDELVGEAVYITPGTYQWLCPPDVFSVSVVTVGAGSRQSTGLGFAASGGALAYKNDYPTVPGNYYTVVVGAPGTGSNGGNSSFHVSVCEAEGGHWGGQASSDGIGGKVIFGDGGGQGGAGGYATGQFAGPGGAGGYSGPGGKGGDTNLGGAAGQGGAASGAGTTISQYNGSGGVGLYGEGPSGAAVPANSPGNGGSGGESGTGVGTGVGGKYGGSGNFGGTPSGGAVRIVWPGNTRRFPSTNVGQFAIKNDVLIWTKKRNTGYSHSLIDTVRGINKNLATNVVDLEYTNTDRITKLWSDGYSVGLSAYHNQSSDTYASWTFRKAAKFFDIITWVGDGTANGRVLPHSLGIVPGMMIVKRLSSNSNWPVYHRSNPNPFLFSPNLNTTEKPGDTTRSPIESSTSTTITLNRYATDTTGDTNPNTAGARYVAYLFAHDPGEDGLIQCGGFTTNASGIATVDLGWEPQYILCKRIDNISSGSWMILDIMRGLNGNTTAISGDLNANIVNAENSFGIHLATVNANGFVFNAPVATFPALSKFIFMAIRRSNKPPVSGTKVYNAKLRVGNNAIVSTSDVGFPPDMIWTTDRNGVTIVTDRLRGIGRRIITYSVNPEMITPGQEITNIGIDGVTYAADTTGYANYSAHNYLDSYFCRAAGVFDSVIFPSTSVPKTVKHGLGAVPEMMIVKTITGMSSGWLVYHKALGVDYYSSLDFTYTASGPVAANIWNHTLPTKALFSLDYVLNIMQSGSTCIAHLFATKKDVAKVGSYIGNGSSQVIDCDFSTGARFILIGRIDVAQKWKFWDSARGIVAGNDPYSGLSVSDGKEVATNDSIDPSLSGFIVNQDAVTNINVTGGNYIYLAFA